MKHINIPVSDELWRDLRQEALNRECSAAEIVRGAIGFVVYGSGGVPEMRKDVQVGVSIVAMPESQQWQENTSQKLREHIDAISDIPVKSRGKGKAELPKMLPRK